MNTHQHLTDAGAESNERVDTRVVTAVAAAKGVDPYDLAPIYSVIESDALDRLVRSLDADGTVAFAYEGRKVSVDGDGRIDVERLP